MSKIREFQFLANKTLKRKNNCQASASEKLSLLAEKKLELVKLQKTILLKEEILLDEKIAFLKAKNTLELESLKLDISDKKQKLEKNITSDI